MRNLCKDPIVWDLNSLPPLKINQDSRFISWLRFPTPWLFFSGPVTCHLVTSRLRLRQLRRLLQQENSAKTHDSQSRRPTRGQHAGKTENAEHQRRLWESSATHSNTSLWKTSIQGGHFETNYRVWKGKWFWSVLNLKYFIFFRCRYINFLASVLASDKPQNERARDSNRKVVVHSTKGKFHKKYNILFVHSVSISIFLTSPVCVNSMSMCL